MMRCGRTLKAGLQEQPQPCVSGLPGERLAQLRCCPHIPQFFKLIELTDLRLHDMNNDAAEIDQYPLALAIALNTQNLCTDRARLSEDPL